MAAKRPCASRASSAAPPTRPSRRCSTRPAARTTRSWRRRSARRSRPWAKPRASSRRAERLRRRRWHAFRRRLGEIVELDFFAAPRREATTSLLASLEDRLRQPVAAAPPKQEASLRRVRGAVWVTRKGVHVDRIASAWLIKRFIDQDAKLKFVPPKGYAPQNGELRFDMFEAEYTHEGDSCTFEVLARRFQISDPAISAIAEVIHDIDVHDGKFERPETPGVERLITGIALTQPDDRARIALGSQLFDALYEAWRRKRS